MSRSAVLEADIQAKWQLAATLQQVLDDPFSDDALRDRCRQSLLDVGRDLSSLYDQQLAALAAFVNGGARHV